MSHGCLYGSQWYFDRKYQTAYAVTEHSKWLNGDKQYNVKSGRIRLKVKRFLLQPKLLKDHLFEFLLTILKIFNINNI